jgi:3-phytase
VVDEATQTLFVGEEKHGVWRYDLRHTQSDAQPWAPQLVMAAGGLLVPDVEGLAIYPGTPAHPGRYLAISSQGNDSFVLIDAAPPFAVRGAFRIGINAARGVDAVSETDGIDISAAALGGPYGEGVLVVQDGHKRLPNGKQNFKLVPWSAVRQGLRLP